MCSSVCVHFSLSPPSFMLHELASTTASYLHAVQEYVGLSFCFVVFFLVVIGVFVVVVLFFPLFFFFFFFFFERHHTPSGKKLVTGVQVVTASQVQSIKCRWQDISSCP